MTRVLLIKTSSLGDVIHTLPALTDAMQRRCELHVDWIVESAYVDIPRHHPVVSDVVPVEIRAWRRSLFSRETRRELSALRRTLKARQYELVIDAQGLLKSALLMPWTNGRRAGYDFRSVRERASSLFYDLRVPVERKMHAVERTRALFAGSFGYPVPTSRADYGIAPSVIEAAGGGHDAPADPTVLFLHGTTWESKEWPLEHWQGLAGLVTAAGFRVLIPWGSEHERERALAIGRDHERVEILPPLSLGDVLTAFTRARGAVALDSGLGHIAAALQIPTVALYGPTNPELTANYGAYQAHVQGAGLACIPCLRRQCPIGVDGKGVHPPCFRNVTPELVWRQLLANMADKEEAVAS